MKLKLMGWVHNQGRGVNKESGEVFDFDSVTLDCMSGMSVRGQNVKGQGGLHYRKCKFKVADFRHIFCGVGVQSIDELAVWLTDNCGRWISVDGMMYNTASGSYVAVEEIRLVDDEA